MCRCAQSSTSSLETFNAALFSYFNAHLHAQGCLHCGLRHLLPQYSRRDNTLCQGLTLPTSPVTEIRDKSSFRWLEEELARRYRDAAPATLALLQERCEGAAAELVAAESRLQAAEDVTSLRRAGKYRIVSQAHPSIRQAQPSPD